jgi:hypothetical protein
MSQRGAAFGSRKFKRGGNANSLRGNPPQFLSGDRIEQWLSDARAFSPLAGYVVWQLHSKSSARPLQLTLNGLAFHVRGSSKDNA